MVEVSVDAEHLTPGSAYVVHERFGESSRLADPVAAGEVRECAIESGRAHGNWILGPRAKAAV